MPQEFQVLRCYNCKTFQVHQVKKINKWNCKLCDEKQSIVKIFGKGTGKECRLHVQELNKKQFDYNSSSTSEISSDVLITPKIVEDQAITAETNKWAQFLVSEDDKNIENLYNTNTFEGDISKVVFEVPHRKKRKLKDENYESLKTNIKNKDHVTFEDENEDLIDGSHKIICMKNKIKLNHEWADVIIQEDKNNEEHTKKDNLVPELSKKKFNNSIPSISSVVENGTSVKTNKWSKYLINEDKETFKNVYNLNSSEGDISNFVFELPCKNKEDIIFEGKNENFTNNAVNSDKGKFLIQEDETNLKENSSTSEKSGVKIHELFREGILASSTAKFENIRNNFEENMFKKIGGNSEINFDL